jgi:[ribosomal protein S5]-alanine N-acetyltransferase
MRIETQRLVLREFVIEDWPAVLAYQRDPRYQRFYPERWVNRTDDEVRAFVHALVDRQHDEPRRVFQLAITLPAERERLIGNCGVRRRPDNEHEAEIGYELQPDYWGRGYATEAARAIAAFGFDTLGVHRLSARCIADNLASVGVLRKLGMRLEGRVREHEYFQGRWWDSLDWGMLADERVVTPSPPRASSHGAP